MVEPVSLELAHIAITDLISDANSTGIIDNNLKEIFVCQIPNCPRLLRITKNSQGYLPTTGKTNSL